MASALTIRDLTALQVVAAAAEQTARVRWLFDDNETVGEGTARSIGDERGDFLRGDQDVRDGFLRITSLTGFEHFVPVTRVMELVHEGGFALD